MSVFELKKKLHESAMAEKYHSKHLFYPRADCELCTPIKTQ